MTRLASGHPRAAPIARQRRGWSLLVLALAVALGIGLALHPATPAQGAPWAPDFTLPAASGARGTVALRALRGHPVLINFFSAHCAACIDEMPRLRQAAQTYRARGVIVLGVATGGDTLADARRVARSYRLPYPVVVDEHQDVAWRYDVAGWPTSFFVDRQGRMQGEYVGWLDTQTVRAGLAQAGAIPCGGCAAVPPASIGQDTSAAPGSAFSADVVFSPPRAAPSFAAPDQQGRVVTPRSLRGKVVALTFVSALCTAQCPLVGKGLSQVRHDLGRDAGRLAIVAVSVAPEVDTPWATWHFAALSGWQGADWHYLSAPRSVLKSIWSRYYVYVGPAPRPGQDPAHYALVYLIDPRGRLRAYYDVPFIAPRVAASVRALLAGA